VAYDVSIDAYHPWDDYLEAYRDNISPTKLVELDQLIPHDDAFWREHRASWDDVADIYDRFSFISEQMRCALLKDDTGHYSTTPSDGVDHYATWEFAGRNSKHLLLTEFDSRVMHADLIDTLLENDPETMEYYEYTDKWCADLLEMFPIWDEAFTHQAVSEAYTHQEQAWFSCRVDDEINTRRDKVVRTASYAAWFIPVARSAAAPVQTPPPLGVVLTAIAAALAAHDATAEARLTPEASERADGWLNSVLKPDYHASEFAVDIYESINQSGYNEGKHFELPAYYSLTRRAEVISFDAEDIQWTINY
jgi:hypothetical protein